MMTDLSQSVSDKLQSSLFSWRRIKLIHSLVKKTLQHAQALVWPSWGYDHFLFILGYWPQLASVSSAHLEPFKEALG